jgi:hypothetical protein
MRSETRGAFNICFYCPRVVVIAVLPTCIYHLFWVVLFFVSCYLCLYVKDYLLNYMVMVRALQTRFKCYFLLIMSVLFRVVFGTEQKNNTSLSSMDVVKGD